MNPASAEYVIGSPLFEEVRVRLPQSDHELKITASGAPDKVYVQRVVLDGVDVSVPVLRHSDLLKASELTFVMNETPQSWGENML